MKYILFKQKKMEEEPLKKHTLGICAMKKKFILRICNKY